MSGSEKSQSFSIASYIFRKNIERVLASSHDGVQKERQCYPCPKSQLVNERVTNCNDKKYEMK